jgi:hypothetical protein
VLVVASLLSAAFAAFQVEVNLQLWVLMVIGVGVAVSGYVMFDLTLRYMASTEDREKALAEAMRLREEEWLKRIGTPARLELNFEGEPAAALAAVKIVRAMKPGSDYTVMYYVGSEGGGEAPLPNVTETIREDMFSELQEHVKQGKFREYKRIICFDRDVLANDPELRSGILRVGEGPGTIDRAIGKHCRMMMKTKGCSLYVAPAVLRSMVVFYGVDKIAVTVEAAAQDTGGRRVGGLIFFCDPPNAEIIEQFRQMERETERRMVAVQKIIYPEGVTGAPVSEPLKN